MYLLTRKKKCVILSYWNLTRYFFHSLDVWKGIPLHYLNKFTPGLAALLNPVFTFTHQSVASFRLFFSGPHSVLTLVAPVRARSGIDVDVGYVFVSGV